jgi:hypothetical protein
MSEKVVQIRPPNPGNGAREVLIELLGEDFTEDQADWLLMALWDRGYKIERLSSNNRTSE